MSVTHKKTKKKKKKSVDAFDPQINRTGGGPHKDPSKYTRKKKHKKPDSE